MLNNLKIASQLIFDTILVSLSFVLVIGVFVIGIMGLVILISFIIGFVGAIVTAIKNEKMEGVK